MFKAKNVLFSSSLLFSKLQTQPTATTNDMSSRLKALAWKEAPRKL